MFLTAIWCAIPVVMLLITLWTYLESLKKHHWKQESKNLFSASIFTLVVTLVVLFVDSFILPAVDWGSFDASLGFDTNITARALLYPLLSVPMARLIGPSKKIRIEKAPRMMERNKNRPRR